MTRFIVKVVLFATLLVLVNAQTIRLRHTGWENPSHFNRTRKFKEQYQESTNTLFFGTSRTLRHLDPIAFDSLNALHGITTRSFNLASSAAFFNEQFYLLDDFFQEEASYRHLNYVFLELDDNILIDDNMLFTTHGSYYITPQNIGLFLKQIIASQYGFPVKMKQSFYHIASMVHHRIYFGQGRQTIQTLLKYDPSPQSDRGKYVRKGYASIDTILPEYKSTLDWQLRHAVLMKDTMRVHRIFEHYAKSNAISSRDTHYNPFVLRRYLDFITAMKNKGVQVICLIPIRGNVTPELVSLYHALPDGHKINMSVHPDITMLKSARLWFDPGHLNGGGATIYTQLVADAFQQLKNTHH